MVKSGPDPALKKMLDPDLQGNYADPKHEHNAASLNSKQNEAVTVQLFTERLS
jgi:hypothetical protein